MPSQAADAKLADLTEHWETVELQPLDRAMVNYAVKLTRTPQQMNATDVDLLRRVGMSDLAIHDLCAVTSYFAFVNRIADGLGVELETEVKAD